MKDATTDLVRKYTFKKEAIEQSQYFKKILESVTQHKQYGKAKAIYDLDSEEPQHSEDKCCTRMLNRIEYFWLVRVTPLIGVCSAVIACLLSLIVITLEVSLYLDWNEASVYQSWTDYSADSRDLNFYLANFICIVPLSYIGASSYFGLFRIRIQSVYALHPKHQTDPPCLVFSGMLVMRLAVAIAYNFLELTGVDKCAFFNVMGPLVKIKFLGEGFNKWVFPSLLFLMILMTAFDCCGRMMNCVGLK